MVGGTTRQPSVRRALQRFSLITETLLSSSLATYSVRVPGSAPIAIGFEPTGVVAGVAVQPVTSWALQAVVSTRAKAPRSSGGPPLVTNKVRVRGSASSAMGLLTGATARLAQSCWVLALQVR